MRPTLIVTFKIHLHHGTSSSIDGLHVGYKISERIHDYNVGAVGTATHFHRLDYMRVTSYYHVDALFNKKIGKLTLCR